MRLNTSSLGRKVRRNVGFAFELSEGPWIVHTLVIIVLLRIVPRRYRRHFATIRLRLPSGNQRSFTVTDITQVAALREVFVDREYDDPVTQPHVIVDLGANAGQASAFFRDRFPYATIIAVEADPEVAGLAAHNFSGDARTVVVNAAISDRTGPVTLTRLPGHSWGSNLFGTWEDGGSQRLSVPGLTLNALLDAHDVARVDLLKVDIEGAELVALRADLGLMRVETVLGELHPSILVDPLRLPCRTSSVKATLFTRPCGVTTSSPYAEADRTRQSASATTDPTRSPSVRSLL